MTHPRSAAHVSDGALIALIDGETTGESAAAQLHVDTCASCRERMSALRRRSIALSRALTLLDEPEPHIRRPAGIDERHVLRGVRTGRRNRWQPALRAAAGIVIVTGIAAAATVGGFGVRIREALYKRGPLEPSPAAVPAATPTAAATGTAVTFDPAGDLLVIEFATRQGGGSVEVTTSPARQVRAQVVAEPGDEEMVLMPGRLEVVNSPASRATYHIMTPPSLRVVVLVGSDTLFAGVPEKTQRLSLQR